MTRLAVIGLAYLLSACQSSLAHLPQGHPAKVANVPARAADLSDCVYRVAQSIRPSYVFHRHARADNLEHVVTATEGANTAMQPELPQLQLRFVKQGETATVECETVPLGTLRCTAIPGLLLNAALNRWLSHPERNPRRPNRCSFFTNWWPS